jgi:membrane protein implicated in regulation of membrane protease activity
MFSLYVICAVLGGILIVLSLMGHGDHGHDLSHDLSHDADHDHDFGSTVWAPFFSLRFWTYFATGIGLTGLALTYFSPLREPMVGILSAATGVLSGLMTVALMGLMRRSESDSSVQSKDLSGVEADVLVPIRPGQIGKIRCRIKGELLDLLASSDENQDFPVGAQVVIVEFEGDRVKVISRATLMGDEQVVNA